MHCTQCGIAVNDTFRFCPGCGAPVVRVQVAPVVMDQPQYGPISPAVEPSVQFRFNWEKALTNGLIGYVVVQVILSFVFHRSVESFLIEWPIYLFFASVWTGAFGIGLPTGYAWGVVIGIALLDTVLFGLTSTISAADSLFRMFVDTAVASLIAAIIGLARGRLEWLGMYNRERVSILFAVMGFCLIAASAVSANI